MDNVGTEAYNRQDSQYSLTEEGEPFDIPFQIGRIRCIALEVILVVNEIELDAVIFILHYTDMNALTSHTVIHIEMVDIFELTPVLIGYTGVIRHNNSYIELFLVDILRKCSNNVSKTACLYKRNALRSGE